MIGDEAISEEGGFGLAMVPIAKEVMERVRELLPPGTHFGVFVLVPVAAKVNQVIAITTDRQVVAPAVAQWCLNVRKG